MGRSEDHSSKVLLSTIKNLKNASLASQILARRSLGKVNVLDQLEKFIGNGRIENTELKEVLLSCKLDLDMQELRKQIRICTVDVVFKYLGVFFDSLQGTNFIVDPEY